MGGIDKEEYDKAHREFEEAQKEFFEVVPVVTEPLSETTVQKPIDGDKALPLFKKYIEKRNALYKALGWSE